MSEQTPPDIERVRRAVGEVVSQALDLTDRIAAAVQPVLDAQPCPRRADLAVVETVVAPFLSDLRRPVQGAGFVAAVGLLSDARWWLEWFARDPDGRTQRLVTHSEPQALGFYDYESLPWYLVPRSTGRPHVTGPYVDYVCTEEYTLTFSTPLLVGDRFVGVAGADIPVKHAEQHLLPSLRAAHRRLAVVNGEGRILSSNDGRHVCGDLLPDSGRAPASNPATYPVAGGPLSIVTLPD